MCRSHRDTHFHFEPNRRNRRIGLRGGCVRSKMARMVGRTIAAPICAPRQTGDLLVKDRALAAGFCRVPCVLMSDPTGLVEYNLSQATRWGGPVIHISPSHSASPASLTGPPVRAWGVEELPGAIT